MEAAICVNYRGERFVSNLDEFSEEEFTKLNGICVDCAKGEMKYLEFKNGNENFYFSKEVLLNSVISVIVKE